MCGRYPDPFHYKDLSKYFAAVARLDEEFGFTPRYNIAPTQRAPIVREDEEGRHLTLMRWGLVPRWAKDAAICSGSRTSAGGLANRARFRLTLPETGDASGLAINATGLTFGATNSRSRVMGSR